MLAGCHSKIIPRDCPIVRVPRKTVQTENHRPKWQCENHMCCLLLQTLCDCGRDALMYSSAHLTVDSTGTHAPLPLPLYVHTSSRVTVVQHIVVQQAGSVDHLGDLRQAQMAVGQCPVITRGYTVRTTSSHMHRTPKPCVHPPKNTHTYSMFAAAHVAFPTRNTIIGRSRLPPAPKI